MDKIAFIYALSSIYLVITGFVIGSVWRLKVHWFYQGIIALFSIYWAPGGLIWFLIQFWIDKKKPKKKKDE